jgi:hypothetical protein
MDFLCSCSVPLAILLRHCPLELSRGRNCSAGSFSVRVCVCVQLRKHEWIEEFSKPVLEQHPTIAEGYLKVVSNPMDLGTVEQKLLSGAYASQEALVAEVNLVFDNAILYNSSEGEVSSVVQRTCAVLSVLRHMFGNGNAHSTTLAPPLRLCCPMISWRWPFGSKPSI